MRRRWHAMAAAAVLALTGCTAGEADAGHSEASGAGEGVAAVVDGVEIPADSVEEPLERLQRFLAETATDQDTAVIDEEAARSRLLSALIEAQVVAALAEREGIEVDEDAIEERFETDRASMPTEEAFRTRLAEAHLTEEIYREVLLPTRERVSALGRALVAQHPPVEVRSVRVVLVRDSEAAQEVLTALRAGEDFSQVAFHHSIDLGSSARGGELGSAPRGTHEPSLDAAIWAARIDELFGPVETSEGLYVGTVTAEERLDLEELPRSQWPDLAAQLDALLGAAMSEAEVVVTASYGTWDAGQRRIVTE